MLHRRDAYRKTGVAHEEIPKDEGLGERGYWYTKERISDWPRASTGSYVVRTDSAAVAGCAYHRIGTAPVTLAFRWESRAEAIKGRYWLAMVQGIGHYSVRHGLPK